MEEYQTIQKLADEFFRVYFIQAITAIGILYLIFSGILKKMFNKILRAKRLKLGGIEIEGDEEKKCPDTGCHKIVAIMAKLEKLEEHLDEVWISNLKQGFYNEGIPIDERMIDGLKYVWWGCNGEVKKAVKEMIDAYPEVYRIVARANKKYVFGQYAPGRRPEYVE